MVAWTHGIEPEASKLYHENHKAVRCSIIHDDQLALRSLSDCYLRRIHEKTDRKDFMSYLLTVREGVSDVQLAAHASDFV
jgi:hypothetical protein